MLRFMGKLRDTLCTGSIVTINLEVENGWDTTVNYFI